MPNKIANKIIVIHNLTDVAGIIEKSESPVSETFDSSKFHIVTVGRIAREKGIDLAVRACAELVGKGFCGFQWWIVGGGPEEEAIRDTSIRTLPPCTREREGKRATKAP